jgi:Protein of unknown function (DUF551)
MEWISVKERIPEPGKDGLEEGIEDVLIAYKRICEKCYNPDKELYISVGYHFEGWLLAQPLSNDVFTEEHNEQILVTHWMPLPALPKI